MKIHILTLALFVWTPLAFAQNECPASTTAPKNKILVGWITNDRITTQFSTGSNESKSTSLGTFRIIAAIEDNKIKETAGSSIKNGQQFWLASNPNESTSLISVGSFLDHMNYNHCVYFASINNNKYPRWSLFTSKPDKIFKAPSEEETQLFYRLNQTCTNQGDYPKGKEPPCTKPKLLAVTDINDNNKPEFWATEPYLWDDGLSIWEYDKKSLHQIFEVCVGCSD